MLGRRLAVFMLYVSVVPWATCTFLNFLFLFKRESLPLAWNSLIGLDWLASEPQDLPVSASSAMDYMDTLPYLDFFLFFFDVGSGDRTMLMTELSFRSWVFSNHGHLLFSLYKLLIFFLVNFTPFSPPHIYYYIFNTVSPQTLTVLAM